MNERPEQAELRASRSSKGATRIGEWVLRPDLGVLQSAATEVRLNSKTLHVLLVLLDAGSNGVSREALLDSVWGENYPSDGVISRAMADLRSAFGEKAGEQKYIRTLPKFGYQFVAEHGPLESNQETSGTDEHVSHAARYKHHYLLAAAVATAAVFFAQSLQTPAPLESAAIVLSGHRPLTSAPGLEHTPRITPDGEWVVYAVMRRDRDDWDLFRTAIRDGATQPVAVTPGVNEHGPAISPFGGELAYVRISSAGCDVVIQSIALGVPEAIAQCTQKFPTLVDWSPTNDQLAYTIAQSREPDSLRRIYLVDRFSGETRRLSNAVSSTGTDFYPRFSPSGRTVAFLRGEPQPDHRSTLWIVDVGSGKETRLTDSPAQLGGMAWIDEGRLLASVSVAGRMRGQLVDIALGAIYPVESTELVHPEYDIRSKLLVAAELRGDWDLAMLDRNGTVRDVALSTSDDHHGSISPDEKWIAFVSRRSGFDEIWIASTEHDAVRRLTRFEGATVRYPDWHPDGSRVLVTVQADAGERLYTIDIVSGMATEIETTFADITTPRWTSGGWVGGCRDDGGWGICVGGDTNIRKVVDGYYRPHPSGPDDILVVDDDGTLFRFSITDGSTTKLLDEMPGNGRFGWEVVDDTLYFLAGGETGNTALLLKVELAGGDPEELFAGTMPVADTSLSIGRQTGAVLFTRSRTSSDDVVLYEDVNFD